MSILNALKNSNRRINIYRLSKTVNAIELVFKKMKKENNISIRIFEESDADHVSHVIRVSMMKTNINDYPLSILKPLHDYFTPSKVKILANERYCLIAEVNGDIVGTGAIEHNELKTIFVLPKYQGLGIGKQLIYGLEKYAISKQIKNIKVPASISGIGFYEKVGYKKGETFESKHAGQQTWMTKRIL